MIKTKARTILNFNMDKITGHLLPMEQSEVAETNLNDTDWGTQTVLPYALPDRIMLAQARMKGALGAKSQPLAHSHLLSHLSTWI